MPTIQKRDLILLLACGVTILISFMSSRGIQMEEKFLAPIDSKFYQNGHFPQSHEKLPPPIVTDLDSDGFNEVVIVTNEYKIKVLTMNPAYSFSSTTSNTPKSPNNKQQQSTSSSSNFNSPFYVKHESSLLPDVRVGSGRRPIALQTGYLTPIDLQRNQKREQHIVVVTDGWTILCFSSTLKLIWESNLGDTPQTMIPSEVAILMFPHGLRLNDKGAVIVGGRVAHKSFSQLDHAGVNETDEIDLTTNQQESHFSYFAFDAKSGALRWKHDQSDLSSIHSDEDTDTESLLKPVGPSGNIVDNLRDMGEMPWKTFKSSILETFPHFWRSRDDTTLTLNHFRKESSISKSKTDSSHADWSSEDLGVSKKHLPGSNFFQVPHSELEHTKAPNVLVAHTKNALEVVHLYTGRMVSRVPFAPKALYADINKDRLIDEITVGPTDSLAAKTKLRRKDECMAYARSGVPAGYLLWNISVCGTRAFSRIVRTLVDEDIVTANIAALYRSSHNGFFNIRHEGEVDSLFWVSSGVLSSVSQSGRLNWEFDSYTSWNSKRTTAHSGLAFASVSTFPLHGVDDIHNEENIIVIGGEKMFMVSSNGDQLASITLPDTPYAKPVFGDVNDDGITDVIVYTARGFYVWTVSEHMSGFAVLIVGIICGCLLLASALRNAISDELDKPASNFVNPSGTSFRRPNPSLSPFSSSSQSNSTPKKNI